MSTETKNSKHPRDDEYLWVLNSVEELPPENYSLFPMYATDTWKFLPSIAKKEGVGLIMTIVPELWQMQHHLMRAMRGTGIPMVPLKSWQKDAAVDICNAASIRGIVTSRALAPILDSLLHKIPDCFLLVISGPSEPRYISTFGTKIYTDMHLAPSLSILTSCSENPESVFHFTDSINWKSMDSTWCVSDRIVAKRFTDVQIPQTLSVSNTLCMCGTSHTITWNS